MAAEQIAISGFKAKKADHDEIMKGFRALLDYEQAHPELFHYSSTRYYTRDDPDSEEDEYWMFIDRFKDFQDYTTSLTAAAQREEVKKMFVPVLSHASGFLPGAHNPTGNLPNLMKMVQHWIEVPSLRVDNQGH